MIHFPNPPDRRKPKVVKLTANTKSKATAINVKYAINRLLREEFGFKNKKDYLIEVEDRKK